MTGKIRFWSYISTFVVFVTFSNILDYPFERDFNSIFADRQLDRETDKTNCLTLLC